MFRLVFQNSEDNTGNESRVTRENIRPEILASLKSFLKIFRNAYVGFLHSESYLHLI